jgi:PAS domain S-box-containing protein
MASPVDPAHEACEARYRTLFESAQVGIARVSTLYAALSQINHALVRIPAPEELFQAVCRALVEQGGFSVAWVGWHDPETQRLVPVATAGDDEGDLQRVAIYADERPEGRGPSGLAFRTGQAQVSHDLLADPLMAPWRPVLERRGLRAGATFPIRSGGAVRGVLTVYDSRPGVFHDREIALLAETATDVAFGLDNFARDEARRRAEAAERRERLFSDAMVDSMPGVVYFYDADGRFLRWNHNFEAVSGYGSAEIRNMHPRDFFDGEDRARVEARIAEVFATGESSIEATLVTRNGVRIPYFFTGRRVVLDGRVCLVGVGIDVSDRRLAETRQAASERKYRELVELASSIILRWDADGRITFLNEFGQRFFGYDADEIVGRLVTDTIVPPTDSGGRDLGPIIDSLRAAPEAFTEHVNENVRRSGERAWVAWTNRVVRDASGRVVEILSIGTDVTERRRAEARLRESEAHLVEAQRIARVGSWDLHLPTGRFTWSDQVYELFGIDRGTFDGTTASFLAAVHPDDRERTLAAHRAARDGTAVLDFEHRIVLPDGREKVVRERASLKRDEAGHPVLLSGTVQDITDRVHMEQERDRRHRAEAADRIKSAFLATMSHELRTPLNSIIGFTGILLQGLPGPINAEQRKQLDMVRLSARHLLALVNDVLDISKIEAGQLEVVREPFDPGASIARVVALVGPQADAKGLGLGVHVGAGLGTALGDARRFEQILLNLLSNAIKFTERGGVSLTATVTGDAALGRDPSLVVAIADTGIGIRAEHLGALFQPFQQIDTGLARVHEGTGLGLAICDRLAKLMGGTVAADSTFGRGSTFTVTLPLPGRSHR